MTTRMIGARIPRNEDPRLLRGLGCFVDDVHLEGTLHAAGLRSPHGHARIVSIDAARARALPGVHLVLTAADLGELNQPSPLLIPHPALTQPRTQRPLATDRVRYMGEMVAFVVAEDRYVAEDAAELIEVRYEPLPAVTELEAALADGSPLVHADVPANRAGRLVQRVGDPDAAFARAARVLRERLWIERSCGCPIETRGVLAEFDPRAGTLKAWISTQAPLPIKNGLARIFGLPEFQVEVIAPDIGGAFGSKIMLFYPEEILVPCAAMRLGRPVKWIEDRVEHLLSTSQERGQLHDVEVAIDEDGRILGLRDRFLHDAGAYTPYGLIVPLITSAQLPGPYRLRNYHVEFDVVYTNKVQVTPYRGAGRAARRLRDGARHRAHRARAGDRAGGGSPPQPDPARRVPVGCGPHLPGRRADPLRQRQLSGRPRHGAVHDRLRRLPRAPGRRARRRPLISASAWPATSRARASVRMKARASASSRAARSSSPPASPRRGRATRRRSPRSPRMRLAAIPPTSRSSPATPAASTGAPAPSRAARW